MTDHPRNPDDPISDPLDPEDVDTAEDGDDWVEVVFIQRPTGATVDHRRDRHDLGWLFSCWAREAGYLDGTDGVRALARALRGLERLGFIDRRIIRRADRPTHHGFVLTEEAREALTALSGDWIDEAGSQR